MATIRIAITIIYHTGSPSQPNYFTAYIQYLSQTSTQLAAYESAKKFSSKKEAEEYAMKYIGMIPSHDIEFDFVNAMGTTEI